VFFPIDCDGYQGLVCDAVLFEGRRGSYDGRHANGLAVVRAKLEIAA